jgi:haloacid dehalogenase-like hydrolase
MILPYGVNKSSGLSVVLNELHLSPHNVVGVGDAENDHAFLGLCECSAAVANAFPALKNRHPQALHRSCLNYLQQFVDGPYLYLPIAAVIPQDYVLLLGSRRTSQQQGEGT